MVKNKREAEPEPEAQDEGMERHLERLEEIADEAPVDIEALSGSLRDAVLELFRHRPKLWAQMSQAEQRDTAFAVERAVNVLVARAVLELAAEDRPHILARLEKFTAKGGKYQAALVSQGGPELAADLARLDGHVVLIISADADRYTRAGEAKTEPDQAPLEFDEPAEPEDEEEAEGEADPPHDPATGEILDEAESDRSGEEA